MQTKKALKEQATSINQEHCGGMKKSRKPIKIRIKYYKITKK